MKTYIVKRLKDNIFLSITEGELDNVLARRNFDGMTMTKQFELIGEEPNVEDGLEELFGTK
jgi:hypothetical protein